MTESGGIVSTTHYEDAVLTLDSCYSRVTRPYNSAEVNCQGGLASSRLLSDGTREFAIG